jgi:hypothetical protein
MAAEQNEKFGRQLLEPDAQRLNVREPLDTRLFRRSARRSSDRAEPASQQDSVEP